MAAALASRPPRWYTIPVRVGLVTFVVTLLCFAISLLFAILLQFAHFNIERILSRDLVACLNNLPDRPWAMMRSGNAISEIWLSQQLRPYGIHPRTIRTGERTARGYFKEEFGEVFRRYIPRSEVEAYKAASQEAAAPPDSLHMA